MPYLEIKDNDNKVYQKFTFKSEQSITELTSENVHVPICVLSSSIKTTSKL